MREKDRNPIANLNKLSQFTTMNVINGQAGLKVYTDKTDAEKADMGVKSTDAIEIARAYGDTFDVKGRLMTFEEAFSLGGAVSVSGWRAPSFIRGTEFWLGTSGGVTNEWTVWYIYQNSLGIRLGGRNLRGAWRTPSFRNLSIFNKIINNTIR